MQTSLNAAHSCARRRAATIQGAGLANASTAGSDARWGRDGDYALAEHNGSLVRSFAKLCNMFGGPGVERGKWWGVERGKCRVLD